MHSFLAPSGVYIQSLMMRMKKRIKKSEEKRDVDKRKKVRLLSAWKVQFEAVIRPKCDGNDTKDDDDSRKKLIT